MFADLNYIINSMTQLIVWTEESVWEARRHIEFLQGAVSCLISMGLRVSLWKDYFVFLSLPRFKILHSLTGRHCPPPPSPRTPRPVIIPNALTNYRLEV